MPPDDYGGSSSSAPRRERSRCLSPGPRTSSSSSSSSTLTSRKRSRSRSPTDQTITTTTATTTTVTAPTIVMAEAKKKGQLEHWSLRNNWHRLPGWLFDSVVGGDAGPEIIRRAKDPRIYGNVLVRFKDAEDFVEADTVSKQKINGRYRADGYIQVKFRGMTVTDYFEEESDESSDDEEDTPSHPPPVC